MPLNNGEVQKEQTKMIVFNCLEEKDENGQYQYWSVKELSQRAQKVASTIHHHLNPLHVAGVLEEKYDKNNPQVPVYRINPKKEKKYFETKEAILSGKIKTSKRTKLRPIKKAREQKVRNNVKMV